MGYNASIPNKELEMSKNRWRFAIIAVLELVFTVAAIFGLVWILMYQRELLIKALVVIMVFAAIVSGWKILRGR